MDTAEVSTIVADYLSHKVKFLKETRGKKNQRMQKAMKKGWLHATVTKGERVACFHLCMLDCVMVGTKTAAWVGIRRATG